jgi:uncharacterized protein (DUF169 family)
MNQNTPLAVKMLQSEDEIPPDAKRPLKDFGVPFSLCQALALGRKEGLSIVLDKESQSCPIALAGLGFVKPDAYLRGEYPLAPMNQSREARIRIAEAAPKFEYGKYSHILISPIEGTRLDPDAIILYGSGAQVMRMIQAAVFSTGKALSSRAVGSGGCLHSVVAPIREGKCNYTIPGNGERRLGLITDEELAFSMPRSRFEEVVEGLKLSHEGKQTYPISPNYLKLEYKLPPPYVELRKVLLEDTK